MYQFEFKKAKLFNNLFGNCRCFPLSSRIFILSLSLAYVLPSQVETEPAVTPDAAMQSGRWGHREEREKKVKIRVT